MHGAVDPGRILPLHRDAALPPFTDMDGIRLSHCASLPPKQQACGHWHWCFGENPVSSAVLIQVSLEAYLVDTFDAVCGSIFSFG